MIRYRVLGHFARRHRRMLRVIFIVGITTLTNSDRLQLTGSDSDRLDSNYA